MTKTTPNEMPLVAVIMGSRSDWETMSATAEVLKEFGVPHECVVVSAHRTPAWMSEFATTAAGRGLEVIIAAAGGAAVGVVGGPGGAILETTVVMASIEHRHWQTPRFPVRSDQFPGWVASIKVVYESDLISGTGVS